MKRTFLLLTIIILSVTLLWSGSLFRSKGEISFESRLFYGDGDSITKDGNFSLFARTENRFKSGPFRSVLRLFGRVDSADPDRSLLAVEEAWIGFRKSGWDIRLGFQMLNWTATEAFHPADIINSRNLDSDIENPEKIGELMLSLKRRLGRGSVQLFVLPKFEAPKFPSPYSRLNFLPAGMALADPVWITRTGEMETDQYGFQWGVRLSQTVGTADFSLFYVDHLDRHQPGFLPLTEKLRLNPVYWAVKNYGFTYSQVLGALIIKTEFNYRDFLDVNEVDPDLSLVPLPSVADHGQLALGVEYGWNYRGGAEGTLILEAQGLFGVEKAVRAMLHPFQRDLLLGYRHAWNDVMSREFLITVMLDLEREKEFLINTSYKQRLSDTWSLKGGARIIFAPVKEQIAVGLENYHRDHQVYLTLTRYF